MAELVPSVLLYGQAMKLLEDLAEAQNSEDISSDDIDDLISDFASILSRFSESAGRPLVKYSPVAETEPPSSQKTNKFWTDAERDINLMQQQVDMLRASAVFSYNTLSTEVNKGYNKNARLNNKLKTLQLYSNGADDSIISFGDSFKSFDSIDLELTPSQERPTLAQTGYVTLGRRGRLVNLSEDAEVKILSTSNGFLGNNQEVEEPDDAPVDPNSGLIRYTFKHENNPRNDLDALLDDEPDTWIEYESNLVSESDRLSAKNFNFSYTIPDEEEGTTSRVNWAEAPEANILKLGLEFDLGEIELMNSVEFVPHGLEDNKNHPILVRSVQTSPNGTDWTKVFPTDVWIGNEVNLPTARAAKNIVTQRAVWSFESRAVRYVRVYVEQRESIDSNVGHVYWANRRTGNERVEGSDPRLNDLDNFYKREVVGDLVQRREFFPGQRWAIGIRDISLQQAEYFQRSVIVTKPLRPGGVVDRVVLDDVDVQIPDEYPTDQPWVNFYVSPDDGENWYQISPIEDSSIGLPEQISFNDPVHESLREDTVANFSTESPVTSVRLKIEILRPSEMESTTPVLRSYSMKIKRV